MSTKPKIIDAVAEWDDPHAFRVFLFREGVDEPVPMQAVHGLTGDDPIETRLYRAAFIDCYADLAHLPAIDRVLGFEKEAAAKRVAKAVKRELKRIDKGEPGMTDQAFATAFQIARMMAPKRRR